MSTSRINELAQRIATNTARIDEYLNAQGLPQPSFAIDAPLKSIIPENEVEVAKARLEVLNDTLELHRLLLGPREYLTSFNVRPPQTQRCPRYACSPSNPNIVCSLA